jgi:hypothetical protein
MIEKEAVVAYCEVLSLHFPGGTEENAENSHEYDADMLTSKAQGSFESLDWHLCSCLDFCFRFYHCFITFDD